MKDSPELSIVVVLFNMRREAPRTLYSLSAKYQRGVSPTDYEVVVVDNGSNTPLDSKDVSGFGDNFSYLYVDDAQPSPAAAVNLGVAKSRSRYVGIMIDGARIASPGVVGWALRGLRSFHPAVVGTVGFHLGPDIQTQSTGEGYDRHWEDELLWEINWEKDGYRLFEVSYPSGSSARGWFGSMAESNLLFLPRSLYVDIGGFDERFDFAGGGFVNLDFYKRACETPGSKLITLLGEATFHQMHGGIMTNRPASKVAEELRRYADQYQSIRGQPFSPTNPRGILFGELRSEAAAGLAKMCDLELARVPSRVTRGPAESPGHQETESGAPRRGDEDHRAVIGPPRSHDLLAAAQFNLLTSLGLREQHRLLDFRCGSPTAGLLLISYLGVGRYWGVKPDTRLSGSDPEHELGREIIQAKRPTFFDNKDFNLDVFGERFDFIIAQSVFSHTGRSQLRMSLKTARDALKTNGILVASFAEGPEDVGPDEWVYPDLNQFSWATIGGMCSDFGFHCRKLSLPHDLQTWFVASAGLDTLLEAMETAGIATSRDDQVSFFRRES